MIAIGPEELGARMGKTILCPQCGLAHPIEYGDEVLEDGTKVPSTFLSFYRCQGKAYLVGVNGRAIARCL